MTPRRATTRRLRRACATPRRRARRRAPARRARPCACRPRPSTTATCASAKAATCGRCVTHNTWCRPPNVASARPTAVPASPPMPASTSSNTRVGGAAESTTRRASIARASSPPEAALARGRADSPGFGRQQEGDVVGAVVAGRLGITGLDRDLERRGRHRQLPEIPLDRRGERPGGLAPSGRQRARPHRRPRGRRRRAPPRAPRPGPRDPRAARAAHARRRAYACTSASVGPYLRTSSRSRARRCCTSASRCGSATICSAATRTSCADLRGLDLERAQPVRERRERLARRDRRDRGAERVQRGAFELRVRVFERRAVRFGVGEDLLLGRERGFFVGILDPGGVDLGELVTQQVELAGARRGRRRRSRPARLRRAGARRAPRTDRRARSAAGAPA